MRRSTLVVPAILALGLGVLTLLSPNDAVARVGCEDLRCETITSCTANTQTICTTFLFTPCETNICSPE